MLRKLLVDLYLILREKLIIKTGFIYTIIILRLLEIVTQSRYIASPARGRHLLTT